MFGDCIVPSENSAFVVIAELMKGIGATSSLAACLALACATPAKAEEQIVEIDLKLEIDDPGTEFEGWGTALAWFAHVTGGWPDAEREQLADLFYGKDGLGFTIARYNIGGGNSPETEPYLRVGADIPGFWKRPLQASGTDWWDPQDPSMWNWEADANQRWWLDAIKNRVDEPIFEAFSNSPPYFMTVSGLVSGHEDRRTSNLSPGNEKPFAEYLVRVTAELERRHGIQFRTLSPINEPNTDYWHSANTQEGSHWSPADQVRMIEATHLALREAGLKTAVSAPDETSSQLFLENWAAYPAETRRKIGQLNVHSYGNLHQTAVRDIARASGIRLWMSENDTPRGDAESIDGMATPLAFAEHMVLDLKRLEPSAWVFWQAVETYSAIDGKRGTNWGLVKANLRGEPQADHRIAITKKFWAMAQFSRYIRPGYRLVESGDIDTVAAVSPDGETVVIVHVNAGPLTRQIDLPDDWTISAIATTSDKNVACTESHLAEAESITTFVMVQDAANAVCR